MGTADVRRGWSVPLAPMTSMIAANRAAPGGLARARRVAHVQPRRTDVGLMLASARAAPLHVIRSVSRGARDVRARGSARSHAARCRVRRKRALGRPTGDERAFARVARAERARCDARTDMRGGKPTARRSPARTIAHLFARVANAVTAAWAGGDPIITPAEIARSLFFRRSIGFTVLQTRLK